MSWQDQNFDFEISLLNSILSIEVIKLQLPNHFLKKVSKTDPLNYPLPLLSKSVERTVHDKTQELLSQNKILTGFRLFFRKPTLPAYQIDKITTGIEKGLFTAMILIDLQKAFDNLDHQILQKNIYNHGQNIRNKVKKGRNRKIW